MSRVPWVSRAPRVPVLLLGMVVAAGAGGPEASAQARLGGRALMTTDAYTGAPDTEMTLAVEPRLRFRLGDGSSLRFAPAAWIDLQGNGRTVTDPVRFEWTKTWNEWEVMLGASGLSWGVMESHRAVDIINQRLPTSSPGSVTKLAQPMARVTVIQPFGTISAHVLPGFKERPHVGAAGTTWAGLPVYDDRSILERRQGGLPVDWAVRWSHEVGSLELAASHFVGRSRHPTYTPGQNSAGHPILRPTYDITDQTSLEAQWTAGRWLLKAEGLIRTWRGARIGAFSAGVEHVVADYLSLFLEYLADSRRTNAPTSYEHDVFVGGRVVFDGGNLAAGAFLDTESGNWQARVSLLKSLDDRLALRLEATGFGGDAGAEPRYALRHRTCVSLALVALL